MRNCRERSRRSASRKTHESNAVGGGGHGLRPPACRRAYGLRARAGEVADHRRGDEVAHRRRGEPMPERMTTNEGGMLRVALLGAPALTLDGVALRFKVRPRVVPLLAYLLMHALRPTPRDDLAFTLWPDDTEEAARSNLRRHLHYLRDALPAHIVPWIVASPDRVQWNPDASVTVDVAEFERLRMRRESRAEAIGLYGGDLLRGCEDEWLLGPRERLRAQYLETVWDLALDARSRSDHAPAAAYLQRVLAADPWREDALRELMMVRYASGDRPGALSIYSEFEGRLASDMGATPMPETSALRYAMAEGLPLPRRPAPHNVPSPASSFVGRVAEIAEIERRIGESRLVTVVGAGGVGKTRAALLLAGRLLDSYADGVWFVDLAQNGDAALTVNAIASALGVPVSDSEQLETLQRYLAPRSLLLVLDNCEHLIAEVAHVVDALLPRAPQVRVLATSRQSLGVGGESVYRMPSLAAADAVALFATRGHAAGGEFSVTGENAPLVAEVCRRLDGIPLAIELAAARLRVLSIAELARMLDERFRVLVGGDRAGLARQRTMLALIDWSYDLLSAPEQRLFERLSVFAGGCTLESARAVCGGDGVDGEDLLSLLSSLIDKSLVVVDPAQAATRYRLLESSREYGREKLVQRGEDTTLARRHAEAHLALAQRLERTESSADPNWAAVVEDERGNWLAALAWSLDGGNDAALGQRLILTRPMWVNLTTQPRRWLSSALAAVDASTPVEIAAGLQLKEAAASTELGEFEDGSRAGQRAVAMYREAGNAAALPTALHVTGVGLVFAGRIAEGTALIEEAIEASRAVANRLTLAYGLLALGQARQAAGDLAADRELTAQARRAIGEERLRSTVAGALWTVSVRNTQAENAIASGDPQLALEHVSEATSILRALRHRSLPVILARAAAYLIALERYREAREQALEALDLVRDMPAALHTIYAIQHLAAIAALRAEPGEAGNGDRVRAARLVGFVEARLRERRAFYWYTERQEWERIRSSLESTLDEVTLTELVAEGEWMSADEAVKLARSV